MGKKIYWHLPGFYYFYYLNQIIMKLMRDNPEQFNDGYEIGSVYGTFPGAIWNGGRAVFGLVGKSDIERVLNTYNRYDIPVRFTWTNSLLDETHINDTYCNLIMKLANNGKNQVLVNTSVLEDYLKSKYPDFKYISSTTKRIIDLDTFQKELEKDYFMVVLDYDLNHDEKVLEAISPYADRIEILVDEICYPNCPKRRDHYRDESRCQLEYEKDTHFDCPNRKVKPSFEESMHRPAFISKEDIKAYIDRGFCNFKLVGRGLPLQMVVDSYIYYLVKDEYKESVSEKLNQMIFKTMGADAYKRL